MNILSLFKFTLTFYNIGLFVKEKIAKVKYHKWITLSKRNNELKDYKKNDVCYICGNGPSLKKVNFDLLEGDTIVMNDHWRISDKHSKSPTYYLINDNAYADLELRERLEGVLKCCPEIPHVFSVSMGPTLDSFCNNYGTNIFYYNNIGRTFKKNYPIDFTKCTYYTWNVVSAAIQFAIFAGYKKIYLLGCDYSLFATQFMKHMYDKENTNVKFQSRLRDRLFKYSITTHIHYEISQYAIAHNVEIKNLTSSSLLDAYEIDFNSPY